MSAITADLQAPRRLSPRLLLLVVLLLVALVLASIAVYIGTQTKLPPLYGPARNGLVVTAADGNIVGIDAATGSKQTLIAGSNLCCVTLSPDGRLLAYSHIPPGGDPTGITIANFNGNVVLDLQGNDAEATWFEWAPAGDRILLTTPAGPVIVDVPSGRRTDISTPYAVTRASWVGTGGDILLSHISSSSGGASVYRLAAGATQGATPVKAFTYAVREPSVSPDGTKLLYFVWGPEEWRHGRVHVYDLATGVDTAITPEDPNDELHSVEDALWSPDASVVAAVWFGVGFDQIAIIPAAGGPPRFVGPRLQENGLTGDSGGSMMHFSPDGTTLLVWYGIDDTTWLLPIDGSPGRQVDSTHGADIDWQRLAP